MAEPEIGIEEQLECAKREVRMRERVYPRWVENKKMSQKLADRELAAMRAIVATLEKAASAGRLI